MSMALLDLSLVHYDPTDPISHALAVLTLSPILVIPAYLAVLVFEREATILCMLAGQLINEAFSWLMKRHLKAERPPHSLGTGYGSPSSHAQFMGYLWAFLTLHLLVVQAAPARWSPAQRAAWTWKRSLVISGAGAWTLAVAFSRWYLSYHSPSQIALGLALGIVFALPFCLLTEIVPFLFPASPLGRARRWVVDSLLGGLWPLSTLEFRDRWAGRPDGWSRAALHRFGVEDEDGSGKRKR